MAIAELEYMPEQIEPAPIEPAIEVLDYIRNLQIPELQSPAESEGIFFDLNLGRVLAAIAEVHGAVAPNSAGRPQLHGTDGKERFILTKDTAGMHAVIFPHAPWDEQLYTIPFSIRYDTGRPLVQYNVKPSRFHNAEIGEHLPPPRAFEEVQHLAGLIRTSLENPDQ